MCYSLVILLKGPLVCSCIGNHFQQQRTLTFRLQKPTDALLHGRHVDCLAISDTILLADTLCGCLMLSGYILVTGRALFQSWQHVKDAATTIV